MPDALQSEVQTEEQSSNSALAGEDVLQPHPPTISQGEGRNGAGPCVTHSGSHGNVDARTLTWTAHPLLPVPGEDRIADLLMQPAGLDKLVKYYMDREELIRLSERDPFRYGTEPEHWKDADRLRLMDILILIIFGGNRAGKSEYAAKRVVQDAMKYGGSIIFCIHENETSSIALQQKYIWRYLPPEIQKLNGKAHPVHKVRYSQANGFADRKLVFPNGSEIYFLTYHQKPGDFEGLELGSKHAPSIGAWGDENLPLPWLNMLKLRLASRSAILIWTFTPVNGITPTIKEVLGTTAVTEESRFAALLGDRVNIPGLPVGHMPYIQRPFMAKAMVIYFHSILNPFGDHYKNIVALCEGRPTEYVERRAYGYSRDVALRAFPLFGPWNIVKEEQLPATGTNYQFTDPAGSRNWANIWIRCAPGNPGKLYVYRDWPPEQEYGEWAVPTEREMTEDSKKGWDGDAGPAQNSLGYGIAQYKQEFKRRRTITVSSGWEVRERDPLRKRLASDYATETGSSQNLLTSIATIEEPIFEYYIDSRAGKNQHAADNGGTCLVDELARQQVDPKTGAVIGESLFFRLASGVDIQEGITAINTLLWWNQQEPLIPEFNEPLFYVCENARQVIWAMQNYTGMGGETGACKDFIDLVRYAALARLRHVSSGTVETTGAGAY